jgi:L-xylulokinase
MGAAMIAGVGAGLFDGYQDAVDRIVSVEHIYQPDSEEQAYYEEKYSRFSSLWNHLNAYYKGE